MFLSTGAPSHWPLQVRQLRTNAISSLLVNEISIHLILKVQPELKVHTRHGFREEQVFPDDSFYPFLHWHTTYNPGIIGNHCLTFWAGSPLM